MDTKQNITYTINLAPGLTTIFIVFLLLKVFSYITWSWWWVTSPMWFMPAFVVACMLFAAVVMLLVGAGIFIREVLK